MINYCVCVYEKTVNWTNGAAETRHVLGEERKLFLSLTIKLKFNSKQKNNLNVILNSRTLKGECSGNTSRDRHNQAISQNDSIFNRKKTLKVRLWKFNIWARKLTIQSKDNLNNKASPLRLHKEYKYLEYIKNF